MNGIFGKQRKQYSKPLGGEGDILRIFALFFYVMLDTKIKNGSLIILKSELLILQHCRLFLNMKEKLCLCRLHLTIFHMNNLINY